MRIPLDKIEEGIEASLANCKSHLASAETLASNNQEKNATINLEFAIEEFGRAAYLRNRVENKSENVDDKIKFDHDFKYDWAWSILPTELKTIYESTISLFDPAIFDPAIFDTTSHVEKETLSPYNRLQATFVNYDPRTEQWKLGIRADKNTILKIVEEIREQIDKTTWH